MTAKTRFHRGLRLLGSFALLAAICACGGSDDDDAPPPAPTTPTPPPVVAPAPNAPVGVIAQFDLAPGFTPDPRLSTGNAGGPVQASTLNPSCRGYVTSGQNHMLNLTAPFTNLRIVVSAARDTTLVVQLADGTYRCDDDGGEGMNPLVTGAFPAGLHRIFVGTYSQPAAGATFPYTIGVSELPTVTATSIGGGAPGPGRAPAGGPTAMPPPPGAGAAPAAAGAAMVNLRTGFMPDPHTTTGTAGGPVNAGTFDPSCVGSIPSAAQHTMMLGTDFRNLRIMVNSSADTTLVIRGPDGRFRCNDDGGGGFRPMVSGAWGPGSYQVWVGVYANGAPTPYTIGFSELASVTASSLPLP